MDMVFNSDLIYAAAKELFIEKGYKKATFAELSARVGVHKSLITYYFKTKLNLAEMIIHEYALDYSKLADKAVMLCKGELDPLYVSAMRNFIMFHGFEENKPLARFYMEFIDEVGPPVYGNLKRTLLEKMQEKLSLPINEKRLKFIQMADDAIRISLVKSFFSGGTDLSLDEAIELKVKLTLQMYNLPEDHIDEIYKESKEIFEKIHFIYGPGLEIRIE